MKIETIKTTTKQAWLEARLHDITSTEISALFNCSPYCTVLDLFYQKKNKNIEELKNNSRMKWGLKLESVIAQAVSEDLGLEIAEMNDYLRIAKLKIGSSFDYKIKNKNGDWGILEIKNVDSLMFKQKWIDENDDIQAPLHIEMQLQHQLFVSGLKFGYIAVLVGGNDLKIIERQANIELHEQMLEKIAEFWTMIKKNNAPKAEFPRDADLIISQFNTVDSSKVLDAEEDIDLRLEIQSYFYAHRRYKEASAELKEAKAKILVKAKDATSIVCRYGKISSVMTKENLGILVTKEMLGTRINSRKSYRTFKFTASDIKD